MGKNGEWWMRVGGSSLIWALIRKSQSQGKDIICISAFFFSFFFSIYLKLPPQGILLKQILATFVVQNTEIWLRQVILINSCYRSDVVSFVLLSICNLIINMHDYYSSQQSQINLLMCTDPNRNRPHVIKGYYYSYFKEIIRKSNYDFPVIRKNILLVLEKKNLSK